MVTELLRPYFTDLFKVWYDPEFPRPNGSTFSLFQVVFVVGPDDDLTARAAVHEHFQQLIWLLSSLPEVQQAEVFALRARRHLPGLSHPDHPQMFIECNWHGPALSALRLDVSRWHSQCSFYVNRFDRKDPLNVDRRDRQRGSN